jgi:hypothetical protein
VPAVKTKILPQPPPLTALFLSVPSESLVLRSNKYKELQNLCAPQENDSLYCYFSILFESLIYENYKYLSIIYKMSALPTLFTQTISQPSETQNIIIDPLPKKRKAT